MPAQAASEWLGLSDAQEFLGEVFQIEAIDLKLPELQGTIEEIAKDKCRQAAKIVSY